MNNTKIICGQVDISLNEIEKIITKGTYTKTDILNVQFHSGRLLGCFDILEIVDFEKFIEVVESSKDLRDRALRFIDNLYKIK